MTHTPALIVVVPLIAALLAGIFTWIEERLTYPIALTGTLISMLSSFHVLSMVLSDGVIHYKMAGWMPPMGIEYRIDLLNAMVLCVVSFIAFVNLIASYKSVAQETHDRSGFFYTIYLLFVTGLLGVTATGDLFNLYVLIEITSLTSYAMVALADHDRGPLASLNYVFIGVIGASFYLLGVGYLYLITGSLNMVDVAHILKDIHGSGTVLVAFILCMIGIWVKMALFPLHVWLPNAYSYSPIAFARIVAPLMTKVMVYVMIRLMITVFGLDYILELNISNIVVWLATIAIISGGIMALSKRNLKKILAYIIVCEIGYMVGGAWMGNQNGMTGAILHILNDALMTFALFLAVGNMFYVLKSVRLNDLAGLFVKMPWTMAGFVVAAFSIVGVPPTCGFFSKWYLLKAAFEAGAYHFAAALIISSLICAVLFFKVFEICFFEPMSDSHDHSHGHKAVAITEAPVSMVIVSGIVSFTLIVVGVYSGTIVNTVILPFLK